MGGSASGWCHHKQLATTIKLSRTMAVAKKAKVPDAMKPIRQLLPVRELLSQASSMITITGAGDHDRPDWHSADRNPHITVQPDRKRFGGTARHPECTGEPSRQRGGFAA